MEHSNKPRLQISPKRFRKMSTKFITFSSSLFTIQFIISFASLEGAAGTRPQRGHVERRRAFEPRQALLGRSRGETRVEESRGRQFEEVRVEKYELSRERDSYSLIPKLKYFAVQGQAQPSKMKKTLSEANIIYRGTNFVACSVLPDGIFTSLSSAFRNRLSNT